MKHATKLPDDSPHPTGSNKQSWNLSAQHTPAGDPQMRPRQQIRVLLVDDHPVVIRGLRSCLSAQNHVNVVGDASDGQEAIGKARELSPDVVLMDLNMPNMGGLAATERLRQETPSAKVVALTAHNQAESLLRVLRSGARGCLLKTAPAADVLHAVETVHAGHTFFSDEFSQHALNRMVRGHGEGPQAADLSNRECDVLFGITDGLSNKEIASRLNIAVRTVETHRERMTRKLDIHTTAGLTRFAYQKGLISLPG